MTVFNFTLETMAGHQKSLADYEGKILLIVNTASKCGFTSQFEQLQQLYKTYNEQGLEILVFPCNQFNNQDPGSNEEIADFCQLNYGVTFQMFRKIDVKGKNKHPLFTYLTHEAKGMFTNEIKWNFTKFLIGHDGRVIDRFAPQTKPYKLNKTIEDLLESL